MKVLHVVKEFSALSETGLYELLRQLRREPADTHVVTASKRVNRLERPFRPVFRLPHYETCLIDPGGPPLKRSAIRGIRTMNSALLHLLLGHLKPDVIHCHFGWSGVALFRLLGKNLTKRRVLVSLHGTDVTYLPVQNHGYLADLRQLASHPHVLFTVNSRYLARKAADIGLPTDKLELLYNSASDRFVRSTRTPFARGDHFSIINVARFVPWKGHRYLLEAFARFHREYQRSSLTLVGDGETRLAMQNRTRELGLEHAVHFTGAVPDARIVTLLASATVYAQPSILDDVTGQVETFGLVVLEAIASGLPVIVTNTGGLPEVVGDGAQKGRFFFLVREKSSSDIADVLMRLVGSSYEFSDNGEYAAERLTAFSPDTQLRQLRGLYQQLRNAPAILG